jgi:hypothetical protein
MDSEQVLVLTRWGIKWLKFAWKVAVEGNSANRFTRQLIEKLDEEKGDPEDFVDVHVHRTIHTIQNEVDGTVVVGDVTRKKAVLRKGRRSSFAASIAREAYNKFGERPMSEANVLVTRKWLQKLLAEPKYKDLRTCDKNLAIDRALFLSFVPTKDFLMMKKAVVTQTWKDRVGGENVFGKVFRLIKGSGSDEPDLQLI